VSISGSLRHKNEKQKIHRRSTKIIADGDDLEGIKSELLGKSDERGKST
jgi:hypothetical protein